VRRQADSSVGVARSGWALRHGDGVRDFASGTAGRSHCDIGSFEVFVGDLGDSRLDCSAGGSGGVIGGWEDAGCGADNDIVWGPVREELSRFF
jgi:hypothetical protein